jgi:hypothetical protein
MSKIFTTGVALGALYAQKFPLKCTAVSAELHSTATIPQLPVLDTFSTQEANIFCICSVGQGADIFRSLFVIAQSRLVNSFYV